MTTVREIRLKSRPSGLPTHDNFEMASVELAAPGAGEIQVKNLWMTVDPYMRGRMNDVKSYAPPFQLGKAMDGGAIGEVTVSNDPSLKPGDLVNSGFGWREGFNAPAAAVQKLDLRGLPPQAFLGAAGMPGLTAYAGLLKVASLKDGDVVFVSGAAGAVGAMVCQIAKAKGHTVIGSAGGAEKVAWLKSIGVDEVIECHLVSGGYDYLLKFITRGVSHYQSIIEDLLDRNVGIDKYFSYIVIKSPFVKKHYPIERLFSNGA